MNIIKSFLAVSALAAVGVAHAATVAAFKVGDFSYINSPPAVGTITGTGTTTLDDSGMLAMPNHAAINLRPSSSVPVDAAMIKTTVFFEAFTGNSRAWTTTSNKLGNRTPGINGGLICADIALMPPITMEQRLIAFDFHSYGAVKNLFDEIAGEGNASHCAPIANTPAVPIPATAWLFGSGLLGLAGAARRGTK